MGKFRDLTGQRFGRLSVLRRVSGPKRCAYWECKCDCGKIIIVRVDGLTSKGEKSCGCLRAEKFMLSITKHGHCNTRLYRIWGSMVQRCCNPNDTSYFNYGGRGITLCLEWRENFESFYQWAIHNGYDDSLQIDRIDNDKGYEPPNCRFVTRKENNRNKRDTCIITFRGEAKSLAEHCENARLSYDLVWNRLNNYHWTVERALTTRA